MRYSLLIAVIAGLTGCVGSDDIIAWASHRDPHPNGGTDDDDEDGGTDKPDPSRCAPDANYVVVVSTEGQVFRVQPDTGAVDDLGTFSCLPRGYFGVSVDRAGSIWLQPNEGEGSLRVIDPTTKKCTELGLTLEAGPMAFVYDPATESETLYISEIGILAAVDPHSLKRTIIGPLDRQKPGAPGYWTYTRAIMGSDDGQLYGVTDVDGATSSIGRIDLHTADIETVWPAVDVSSGFVGAAAWGDDFIIGRGAQKAGQGVVDLFRFSTATEQSTAIGVEFANSKFYMGASTCTSQPQAN